MLTILLYIYGISLIIGIPWFTWELLNAPQRDDWD